MVAAGIVLGCSGSDGGGARSGETDGGAGGGERSDAGGGSGSDGGVAIVEAGTAEDGGVVVYGASYGGGQFHLGPVDWDETQFHNACAPGTKYAPAVRQAEGTLLAGLWNGIPNVAGYCDACIFVTTGKGKSALLRVVTYGDTSTNSIDVSPDAFAILNSGEYPRAMTWQLAECPDTGAIVYEFQTGANEWWTSLWVRNARVPLVKVEVQSKNHPAFAELARGSDGTLTDGSGFGAGPFTIRLTGIDGRQISDSFEWPAAGIAGQTLTAQGNFP
jgi:expansin (peptidoglycan-binding protein)